MSLMDFISNTSFARHLKDASMSVKETIILQMQQIAREQSKKLPPLRQDLPLLETGLDSLSIAILVARLEDVLRVDPFNASDAINVPVTLADFIKLYEVALGEPQA